MAYFNEFPHTRTYDSDLGWLIKKIGEVFSTLEDFVALNGLKIADPIYWDITKQYPANTIVINPATRIAYISRRPVPAGASLDNEEYWLEVFSLGDVFDEITTLEEQVEALKRLIENLETNLYVFDTYAAMTAELREEGQLGFIRGFYSPYDGGSGFWMVTASDVGLLSKKATVGSVHYNLFHAQDVNPKAFGARLDRAVDDTAVFSAILQHANIKMPLKSDVQLNNLTLPDFTTIDFSDSFVYTDSYAIWARKSNEYTRGIVVKNAHIIPISAGSTLASKGGIKFDGVIKGIIDHVELANPLTGYVGFHIRNSFSVTVKDCYCGTGNASRINAAAGLYVYMGEATIQGTDNITNLSVKNCLFQQMQYGIFSDSSRGLLDTGIFENIGISSCGWAVWFTAGDYTNRNITIDTLRAEFCDSGMNLVSNVSLRNVYFLNCKDQGIYIRANGVVDLSGNAIFMKNSAGQNYVGINNAGKLNMIDCVVPIIGGGVTFNLGMNCIRPRDHAVRSVTAQSTLSAAFHPIYDTVANLNVSLDVRTLPTPTQNQRITLVSQGSFNITLNDDTRILLESGEMIDLLYRGGWYVAGHSGRKYTISGTTDSSGRLNTGGFITDTRPVFGRCTGHTALVLPIVFYTSNQVWLWVVTYSSSQNLFVPLKNTNVTIEYWTI